MSVRKLWRGLKYTTALSGVGASAYYLHKNDWDLNSTGPVRFGRAALAACKCVIDYKWSLYKQEYGTEEYQRIMSEAHTRSATRLRDMCCKNRGVFIKVGQHIGALEFLLPKEYVDTMKVLHSNAPESPLSDIKQVIKEDLGQDAENIFKKFEEEPIGVASLAQVHKAELCDGRVVAIKVQHPQVLAHSIVDIATMEVLFNFVSWVFPEFNFGWLAELTKKNLPLELNFANEADNCERMHHMFIDIPFVKVPEVYRQLTTSRVLTMEYCDGGKVDDKQYMNDHGIDVNEVTHMLGAVYSEMIFKEGFVHCDPHPGNVLVQKDKSTNEVNIVLLDHGLYQTLNDDFRMTYCYLWQSVLDRNMKGVKKYSQKLGTGELFPLFAAIVTGRSWDAVNKGVSHHGNREMSEEENEEIKGYVMDYFPEIADVLNRVPRPMIMLLKTNDLLRGIETNLKTRANASSFNTMSKCCIHSVYKHKRKQSKTKISWMLLIFEEYWKLFQIRCYEFYLWCMDEKRWINNQLTRYVARSKAHNKLNGKKQILKEKVQEQKEKMNLKKENGIHTKPQNA